MNAKEIVNRIADYAELSPVPACSLHSRCGEDAECGYYQVSMAYNFDLVEQNYSKNCNIESLPSADAIIATGGKVIFLEYKSWKSYLERIRRYNPEQLEKQAKKYATIKKFICSIEISRNISDSDFFDNAENVVYVLATDIDNDPMKKFTSSMYFLSATSTKLDFVCRKLLDDKLKENFKDIDYKYKHICCWKLDKVLAEIG